MKPKKNLQRLIPALRKDYDAPNAKFVIGTGCGHPGRESYYGARAQGVLSRPAFAIETP